MANNQFDLYGQRLASCVACFLSSLSFSFAGWPRVNRRVRLVELVGAFPKLAEFARLFWPDEIAPRRVNPAAENTRTPNKRLLVTNRGLRLIERFLLAIVLVARHGLPRFVC